MKQTGEEYRLKNRQRLHKFYERHEAKGKRRISALISGEAYTLLAAAKDSTGGSISALIDQALLDTFTAQVDAEKNMAEKVNQNGKLVYLSKPILPKNEGQDPVTDAQADEPSSAADTLVPDCTGKRISKDERDKILLALDATDMSPQEKVDLLTMRSIPSDTRTGPYKVDWTVKKITDQLDKIRKRAK